MSFDDVLRPLRDVHSESDEFRSARQKFVLEIENFVSNLEEVAPQSRKLSDNSGTCP